MPHRPEGIAPGASWSVLTLLLLLAAGVLLAWLAPDLWLYWLAL